MIMSELTDNEITWPVQYISRDWDEEKSSVILNSLCDYETVYPKM